MRITSTSAERWKSSTPSETVSVVCVSSAPAMPAIAAAMVKTLRRCARLSAPIARMRTMFSRMPRSDRPNGEWISRRLTRNRRNSTMSEYQYATRPHRSKLNMPNSGHMRTPCRPSAPPVSQLALLASSISRRPKPSVIMISARWRKRAMMKLIR